jgi:glucose-6-phosphate 1-dehydrogenase
MNSLGISLMKKENSCLKNKDDHGDQKVAKPCILVVFGVTGDLTKRLLYPSICHLGNNGLLDQKFCILGVATSEYTDESFREEMAKHINEYIKDEETQKYGISLLDRMYYLSGDFNNPNIYVELKKKLEQLEANATPNYIFYMAVPPEFFSTIVLGLGKAQLLNEEPGKVFRRIVIEKPFGHDLESAKELNLTLLSVAKEHQIFRIDHFLGKETVQNIFAFRFSNDIFEPIWNRKYIDHVQITVAETLGVEQRGRYYEHAGALRDMIPNHLFQVLTLIAMEPPGSFSTHEIQEEKANVLNAIQALGPKDILEHAVRGQYGPGSIGNVEVPGYRSENHVDPDSDTETYVALKLYLNNWRWLHVPFYLRTGKRLKAHTSQVVIQFKSDTSCLFRANQKPLSNILRIYIQPDDGISLRFNAKIPGLSLNLGQVEMSFKSADYFGLKPITGYETILYDCMNGKHMLFKKAKVTEAGWEIVDPILDIWSALKPRDFPNYAAGTWGPKEADDLLQKDGRKWIA